MSFSYINLKEYSTTFTYNKGTETTTKEKIKQTFTTPGFYRYITTGTVHVYGVVGYDVATASYFTYCFNVLDDETDTMWDYSHPGTTEKFGECENGVVAFEIPFEVSEYVAAIVGKTNGLEISDEGEDITDAIRQGHIAYIINTRDIGSTGQESDGALLRQCATENNVTIFTALDTVNVLLDVLEETTLTISTIDA